MTVILFLLAAVSAYSGGMWLWAAYSFYRDYPDLERDVVEMMEHHTFHLGLCFTLAIGFIGTILAIGG